MGSSVFECSNLSFAYGHTPILEDVSFALQEGEHVSLVGPNGAGKTTLLRCLLGILSPQRGRILYRGELLSDPRKQAQEVGYVPQGIHVPFDFRVQDLLEVSRYACLSPLSSLSQEDRREIQRAVEYTDLTSLLQVPLAELSAGQRQRALIASALVNNPSILLLDEPTSFLDPKHLCDVVSLLRKLQEMKSFTMLVVTHDLTFATREFERVLALKNSSLFFDGTVSEFSKPECLESLFEVDFTKLPLPDDSGALLYPSMGER